MMPREVLPLDEKALAFWRTEIKQARQMREQVSEAYGWDDNLKRYVPKPSKNERGQANAQVNIGADFRDVERKKAALFYDTPTVALTVKTDRPVMGEADPMTGQPQPITSPNGEPVMLSTCVSWQQEILNHLLGPNHAHVKPTVLKAIFDCLCPSGVGPVSVGYQATLTPVPVPNPLGLMFPPLEVEMPVHERWFVSRSSPKALLIPVSFKDTDFERAPWLGKDWRKPASQVRREYALPDDWAPTASDETKPYFETDADVSSGDEQAGDPWVTGVDVWYRASLRDPQVAHPELLRHLVLIDGADTPVVHEDSPHQDLAEDGTLTPDSLRGYPDVPLVLRDLSDSAWVPSDCAVTGPLTKELNKYREQIITQRDTNRNVILFDASKVDPTAKDKIVKGPGGAWVPVVEGALAQGRDAIMAQAAQVSLGRESYLGQDIIERDREKILGIASNQSGVTNTGRRTATENAIVQRNSEARFEQERQRVLEWFLMVVAKFDTLVLRYGDARLASQVLGPERGQVWAQVRKALAGAYTYTIQVDSGKYLDIEADRRQKMQMYSQVRQDPFINPRPLLKDIAQAFGYDPAEFISEPKPPEKELKASFSFKAEDLNPLNPQFPLVVKLMRQAGWNVDAADVQIAQQQASALTGQMLPVSGVGSDPNAPQAPPGHPGAQPTQPTLSRHLMDETGQMDGPAIDGRLVQ